MQKINFENLPSTTTPLNATNMNAIQTNVEDVFNGEEPMGDIRVGGIEGKNLFNKENAQVGYLNEDGSANTNSAWRKTDYISVTPGEKITFSGISYPGVNPAICFYNSSFSFISGTRHNNIGDRTITIPSNCYYIRDSISATYDLDTVQIERSSIATTYNKYQGIGYVSGNNENGSYMKFDDGTLICYGSAEYSGARTTAITSGGYRTSGYTVTFPITFVGAIPYLNVTDTSATNNSNGIRCGKSSITTSQFSISWWGINSNSSSTTYSAQYIAIGRWK